MDDILAIPGNRPVYQRLRELLDTRQATASASDEEYWLRTAAKRPLQVASQIHQKLTGAHYYPFVYETFKDHPSYFTPAHDALIRLQFQGLDLFPTDVCDAEEQEN